MPEGFELNDDVGFEENLASFGDELVRADPKLGPILVAKLALLATAPEREDVLDALLAALQVEDPQ